MAQRHQAPPVRLRRLAMELRHLREQTGMSREDVAAATAINRATLYRIEMAQARPQVRTLRALLDVYGVTEPRRTELLATLKATHEQGWLQTAANLPGQYATYIGFEQEARRLLNYESSFVPGLLQTEAYARAVISGGNPALSPEEVENRVTARMERQKRREPPLVLEAIVDESVLRHQVGGPEVMREQLRHLIECSGQPHITLQVTPFTVGAHPGMHGSFIVLQFGEGHHDVVYIESSTTDLFLDSQSDIDRYNLMFEHLRAISASPEATRDLIADVLAEMK